MRWLARFAAWATLFAIPCWALMGPYQKGLMAATRAVLAIGGLDPEFTEATVAAPLEIGIYAALCLASRNVSSRRRTRALLLGIPALMAGDVLLCALVVVVFMLTYQHPEALRISFRVSVYLLESIPWTNACVVWLALLGRDEFPLMKQGAPRRGAPLVT